MYLPLHSATGKCHRIKWTGILLQFQRIIMPFFIAFPNICYTVFSKGKHLRTGHSIKRTQHQRLEQNFQIQTLFQASLDLDTGFS